jgi:hypothetical protein
LGDFADMECGVFGRTQDAAVYMLKLTRSIKK